MAEVGDEPTRQVSSPPRAVERAISLIRKAEVKSVPRKKIKDFLKRKNLTQEEIDTAYTRFFENENLVEHEFKARPLGFSVVMDPQGKNAVISSIQNAALEQEHGLERLARIVKVNDRWVEHKKHQDIIDHILDRQVPITFTFRKRKHPKKGSLFKKIKRPTRSQPAQKSRSSVIMKDPPMKSRGSVAKKKKVQKPKLFNPNNMDAWTDASMESEAKSMKAMLAALTMEANISTDQLKTDQNLNNLSHRMQHTLRALSDRTFDDIDDDFGKDMVSLWTAMDDDNTGGGTVDDDGNTNAYVIEEAQRLRREAEKYQSSFDLTPTMSPSAGALSPPADSRKRAASASTPVYSTDAIIELHKGSALMKYGKRGQPKFRMFQLSKNNERLIWFSDKKKPEDTQIKIEDMVRIETDKLHDTRTNEELKQTSFSIIYGDDQELKLTAKNVTEAYLWTEGLKELIKKNEAGEALHTIKHIALEKRPGLDLHRRQSLANLMEKRTGAAGKGIRAKNSKKVARELKAIRKKWEKCVKDTKTKQYEDAFYAEDVLGVDGGLIKTMDAANKEKEKENITELLANIDQRLTSLEQQMEQLDGLHQDMFDQNLDMIKADAWNASVDIIALTSKLRVIMTSPVPL